MLTCALPPAVRRDTDAMGKASVVPTTFGQICDNRTFFALGNDWFTEPVSG